MAQRDNILGIDAKRALITIVIAVLLLVGAISLIGKAADFDEIVEALDGKNVVLDCSDHDKAQVLLAE